MKMICYMRLLDEYDHHHDKLTLLMHVHMLRRIVKRLAVDQQRHHQSQLVTNIER
jgi:trehalose-6-phosphate synthase